ncbi:MAG TPA: ATP-binding protein [Candidatus Limnocylindria bacterium]|nr:ATP-binding protein [Candidatus Limnocylindria bacterium]
MINPTAAAFEALVERRGGDLVLMVDAQLRIVRAGPAAAELAERPTEALAGMSLIAAFGSAPLDAIARQAATTREVVTGEADLGHLGERQFMVDAVPLVGGGLVLSLHDITALRRMERVRRDFVANIGHELRTPLTSIKLMAETLASGAADEADTAREFAGQIEREVDHLAQLVDELLDLSMIESGQTNLALEPLDPEQVVASCVERIRPVAERARVTVRQLPSPADGVRAIADPARIEQALINLAHNAVKYSHPGGEVRIGWEIRDAFVRFAVSDDGIGVPDAHQPRIFERFYKADRSRTRDRADQQPGGSAGLGLAIVRNIAEAHQGSAGLVSEEGVGSTFWIEVPKAE